MRPGQLLTMHVQSGKRDLAVALFLALGWKELTQVLPDVRVVTDPKGYFALAIAEGDCNLISFGISGFRDLKKTSQIVPDWATTNELHADIQDWGSFLVVNIADIFPYQLMLLA